MFRFYRTPRRSNNDRLAHILNGTLQIDHVESVFYHRAFEFSSTALFAQETRPNVPRARRSRDDAFAEVGLRHRAPPIASSVSPSFATTENLTRGSAIDRTGSRGTDRVLFCSESPIRSRRCPGTEGRRGYEILDRPTIFPRHGIVLTNVKRVLANIRRVSQKNEHRRSMAKAAK